MMPPPLAVRDLGGHGPTFVLVHGYTGSSQDFAEVAPRLTDLRRVVLVDQLGHGDSARAASYSYTILTHAIVAAIEELGAPVDLLGHSLGGRVALPVVLDRPDLVRSLVMMDSWADPPDRDQAGDVFAAALAAGESPTLAMQRFDAARPDPEGERIVARRGAAWHEARLRHNADRVDAAAIDQLAPLVFLDDTSLLPQCSAIRVPVTVLVGELDAPFVGPSSRLADAVPGAELRVIAGAFHSPQLTHPNEWVAAIRNHLERVDAALG